MKKVFIFALALFSTQSIAFDAREIYQNKLIEQPTGVYQDSGLLFFVVKQPCLTTKKYSGTKESKQAEQVFYTQLVDQVNTRSISFNPQSISVSGRLKEDIFTEISKRYDAKKAISHQLLFDRDSKGCIREYVQVAQAEQFEKNKINIPQTDIDYVQNELIINALNEKKYARLGAYFNSLQINKLALIYNELSHDASYPFAIRLNNDIGAYKAYCVLNFDCKSTSKKFSDYDFNAVLATTFAAEGVINLHSLNPSLEMAKEFYLRAKNNFDKGQKPQQILDDLTISLNANPINADAWEKLSAIYRATNKNQLALFAVNQYSMQNATSVEPWVYLLKVIAATDKVEADKLHVLLISISDHVALSTWAQKQIKDYR
ncbi:hypothetical protein [Psychromonas sp.]|uniref:hypothetical protein n=1 Tax=Psychromonas sp. TaxID=1884585 RepID=UPI0035656A4B